MHIKRAKQEIKDSIEAYLRKDETGAYVMPAVRQRPILLMGPPGIGKTADHGAGSQRVRHRPGILYHYPPYSPERGGASLYPGKTV